MHHTFSFSVCTYICLCFVAAVGCGLAHELLKSVSPWRDSRCLCRAPAFPRVFARINMLILIT